MCGYLLKIEIHVFKSKWKIFFLFSLIIFRLRINFFNFMYSFHLRIYTICTYEAIKRNLLYIYLFILFLLQNTGLKMRNGIEHNLCLRRTKIATCYSYVTFFFMYVYLVLIGNVFVVFVFWFHKSIRLFKCIPIKFNLNVNSLI